MRPIACRDSFFSLSGSGSIGPRLVSPDVLLNEAAPAFMPSQYGRDSIQMVLLEFVTENHDVSIAIANPIAIAIAIDCGGGPISLLSCIIVVIQNRGAEDRPKTTTTTKSYQVAHAAPGGHGPPCDCKVQGRWSAASRRGTKSAGHSLLMPHPEVTAHPATAMRKAGSAASRRGTNTRSIFCRAS